MAIIAAMIRVAFVVGEYPPDEQKLREQTALAYSSAEVEVGIVRVAATPYIHGLTPAELALVAPAFFEAYRRAEKEGYDAVVPLGMLDLGVDGGRSMVDIPVLGPCETSMHIAAMVGDRFGCIGYHDSLVPMMEGIMRRYGMQERIVGWRNCGIDLPDLAKNKAAMVENFVAAARSLIEKERADVIIPMGISQCPVHIKPDWLAKELGVPVVEGIGAPIRVAAAMASLGLRHSRRRWPKSPNAGG
ncbi:MAG: aspartate/glutamate racemase family protein [Burkholderiales bacterium]